MYKSICANQLEYRCIIRENCLQENTVSTLKNNDVCSFVFFDSWTCGSNYQLPRVGTRQALLPKSYATASCHWLQSPSRSLGPECWADLQTCGQRGLVLSHVFVVDS